MLGKRIGLGAALAAMLVLSGCCRWCERHCGHHHNSQPCVPCCPAPVCCPQPAYCPTTVGSAPAGPAAPGGAQGQQWQRSYHNACCQ